MAEAIVSLVIEQLGSIIRQELEQETRLTVGVRKEAMNLTATLTRIKAVLGDADERQVRNNNDPMKVWLGELKDIVYDAEDVLDEWSTRILILQRSKGKRATTTDESSIPNKVFSYFFSPCSCFKPVVVRRDIGHRIEAIRERLDVIARDKDQFHLNPSRTHEETRLVTSSIVDASEIHGRDHDKEIILNKLLGETSSQKVKDHLPVISIVGMGGFGKTTLAQLVLRDKVVMTTFQLRMWVCVSEPFDLIAVAKEIIAQATSEQDPGDRWEDIRKHLCNSLRGSRFLLVLDSVWTEHQEDWNPLKLSLNTGALGSRVLVTTRREEVATMMDSTYIHRLEVLSEEDCWSVFRRLAFSKRPEEELEKFEEMGKAMSRKCKGVPLAAKTLASLMRFKRTKQDWRNVLASGIWDVQQAEKGFLPALLLSYRALPSYLKQCFMYCAVIPKGTKIHKGNVVKLWMAQGFLGSDGEKELEIIGGEYFNDLAMRSFFQDFEEDGDRNIITCKMHDLVHDFSQFLATEECSVVPTNDTGYGCNKIRHINARSVRSPSISNAVNLRTLIIKPWAGQRPHGLESSTSPLLDLFHRQTCLRALVLSHYDLTELPKEVDRLIHLRLLDLSHTRLKELPETVSDLHYLQTLKLNDCRYLCKLPERIGELSNLRHLEIEDTCALSFLPRGVGRLKHLHTLCKFILGSAGGGCTIRELRHLDYLTGNLEIIGLRLVESVHEAQQAEMQNKKNLHTLSLNFGCSLEEDENFREDDMRRTEGVLESLQPHNNLEDLRLIGYPGSIFPTWLSRNSLLSNIVTVKLFGCRDCIQLPTLGELESLEALDIEDLESVKHIGIEFYGFGDDGNQEKTAFPKLQKLRLVGMKDWEDWQLPFSKYKTIMPRLSSLTLRSCPKLIGLSSVGKLESLERIFIGGLSSLTRIGLEFVGISDDGIIGDRVSEQQKVLLPRLKELVFVDMEEWEEWNPPFQEDVETMPNLRCLELRRCGKLKELPALGRLQSLETLKLNELKALRHLGSEFLGISTPKMVLFPKLMFLTMEFLQEWDEQDDIIGRAMSSTTSVMPSLHALEISWCRKLKVVPHYMFSPSLRNLTLTDCPQLTGLQPYLPRLLEELILDRDVGVYSRSLPINSSNNPYLKYLAIHSSPCSSLPQGLEQLTSLQELHIFYCKMIDFKPEELEHLRKLRKLEITDCPILLTECCREDWSILSHVPSIVIER